MCVVAMGHGEHAKPTVLLCNGLTGDVGWLGSVNWQERGRHFEDFWACVAGPPFYHCQLLRIRKASSWGGVNHILFKPVFIVVSTKTAHFNSIQNNKSHVTQYSWSCWCIFNSAHTVEIQGRRLTGFWFWLWEAPDYWLLNSCSDKGLMDIRDLTR